MTKGIDFSDASIKRAVEDISKLAKDREAALNSPSEYKYNVYQGPPDSRQSDCEIKVSRFRPQYRQLTGDEKKIHDDIKAKAVELEELFSLVKEGRYHSLALTELELAIMWIIKELTS